MADDDEGQVTVKEVHVGLTKADIEEEMAKVRNELKQAHEDHTRESAGKIADLEAELKSLKDAEAERKKAEEKKEAAKGTDNTLVVPAAAAPQAQTHEDEGKTPAEGHEEPKAGKKRLGWW